MHTITPCCHVGSVLCMFCLVLQLPERATSTLADPGVGAVCECLQAVQHVRLGPDGGQQVLAKAQHPHCPGRSLLLLLIITL